MSLDGKTIANPGDNRQITSSDTQLKAHKLRSQVDAILVGSNTVRTDNPNLSVQLPGSHKNTLRVELLSSGSLPLDLNVFKTDQGTKTLLAVTSKVDSDFLVSVQSKCQILVLPENSQGQVCLKSLLIELGKLEVTSLLVEGGRETHNAFINAGFVSKFEVYVAPVVIADLKTKRKISGVKLTKISQDYKFSGLVS